MVSFVNRPFPLDEADEHFSRLVACGFSFVRLIVTWEAVEHKAPGVYDEEYLSYLRQICEKAEEYGISVFWIPTKTVGADGVEEMAHRDGLWKLWDSIPRSFFTHWAQ